MTSTTRPTTDEKLSKLLRQEAALAEKMERARIAREKLEASSKKAQRAKYLKILTIARNSLALFERAEAKLRRAKAFAEALDPELGGFHGGSPSLEVLKGRELARRIEEGCERWFAEKTFGAGS